MERLIESRGGVIWPQLLPSKMLGGVDWHVRSQKEGAESSGGTRRKASVVTKDGMECARSEVEDIEAGSSDSPCTFSLVEDRLLCR